MQNDTCNQHHDIKIKELIDVKDDNSFIDQMPGISMISTITNDENNIIQDVQYNDVKLNDMLNESELSS
jgi:hypothetical protein